MSVCDREVGVKGGYGRTISGRWPSRDFQKFLLFSLWGDSP